MEHLVNWRGFSWTNFQTRAIELKLASFQKSLSGPTPKVGIEKKLDVKQLNSSWQTQFWMPVNFFLQNLCMSSIFNVECQELIEKLITVL